MFDSFYARLEELAIVPVAVVGRVEDAAPLAGALMAGGMESAEVTFRTPCASDVIRAMRSAQPRMCVGAGTVLTVSQVDEAVDAGAEFVVSPGFDEVVVNRCIELGVPVLPAAVTPTELNMARVLGINVTKFFPAEQYGGLGTIKALAAPYVGHRFMPTGGVSPENVGDYLACPSVIACGGTWMVKPGLYADGSFDEVERVATEAVALVRDAGR